MARELVVTFGNSGWDVIRSDGNFRGQDLPRVTLVNHFYSSSQPSGENKTVTEQFKILAAAGVSVQLLHRSTDKHMATFFARGKAGLITATGRGRMPDQLLDDFGTDIIHVHNTFPSIGRSWMNTCSLPVVSSFHNYRTICSAGTLHRDEQPCEDCPTLGSTHAIRHKCYRASTAATIPLALSTRGAGTRNSLVTGSDLRLAPGTLMRNLLAQYTGREYEVVYQPTTWVPNATHHHRTPTGKWLVAGRLTVEKGILQLAEKWPDRFQLLIYGAGPLERQLTELTRARNHCLEFRGLADPQTMKRALSQVDGLVIPSTWPEGLPLLYAEALSQGTPVVANTVNSVALEIDQHHTGATFAFSTPATLENALRDVTSNYARLSRNCFRTYERYFTPKSWIDQIMFHYKRLTS